MLLQDQRLVAETYTPNIIILTLFTSDCKITWSENCQNLFPSIEASSVSQIAYTTLRRAVGADANPTTPFHISTYISHPMVAPYSQLLKAVRPYRHHFVEEELQGSSERFESRTDAS
jgi:hypothetical protein